jgi:phosphatidate cytidylyltransferase
MTRVVSGAVLVVIVIAVVWLAPVWVFFAVAELVLVLAFAEYARLAEAGGVPVPAIVAGTAAVFTSIGVSSTLWVGDEIAGTAVALDVILMTAFVLLASIAIATWRGERDALARAAASVFPCLYLGLPIGALVALRARRGPEAVFLLMLTIMVSDTAQYYTGRLFGRRPLASAISPKKTIEGAVGGFVFGSIVLAAAGGWWLPSVPVWLRALVGVAVVTMGIAGDLFESMLKRSAGLKDSSDLIPGHGGVLDRIDALLFAAPVYYVVLKYV